MCDTSTEKVQCACDLRAEYKLNPLVKTLMSDECVWIVNRGRAGIFLPEFLWQLQRVPVKVKKNFLEILQQTSITIWLLDLCTGIVHKFL